MKRSTLFRTAACVIGAAALLGSLSGCVVVPARPVVYRPYYGAGVVVVPAAPRGYYYDHRY